MIPRSVRNNNPGNLRIGQPWQGLMPRERMTPEQKAETEFCVFIDPAHGFRALAILLRSYHNRGIVTPREIISRYAPSNENDTEAYIKAFAHGVNKGPDEPIDMTRRLNSFYGCTAITLHETGHFEPDFTNEQLADGLDLAGF